MKNIEISIVIPCYNSASSLEELNSRLGRELKRLNVPYEIIYVNDCSKDNTVTILREFANKDNNIILIDLMYNVGQFRALMCGFKHSTGNYVITMDDDLQHPPEEIHKLYSYLKVNSHLDVLIGIFEKRQHSTFRKLGRALIKKINEIIFNKPKHLTMSSFRCMTRKLIDTIISHETMFPVMGPLILKSTRKIENLIVAHDERKFGNSNYGLLKLMSTSLDNIINFSSLPLKFISSIGVLASTLSFFASGYYFAQYLLGYIKLPGWTTVILLINFYSGLLLLSVGIIGEYLIRILREVNGYPKYVIRDIYRKE